MKSIKGGHIAAEYRHCLQQFFLDVSFLPKQFVGIKNYSKLLSSPDFWQAMRFTRT